MSIDLRGFIYLPENWGYSETWDSKFSEYTVEHAGSGIYRINKKTDEFWSFGDEPTAYMKLNDALNAIRKKAIIKFFDYDCRY
jgi:hypothetical protein